jgi:peptide/nickel transport system permease protein
VIRRAPESQQAEVDAQRLEQPDQAAEPQAPDQAAADAAAAKRIRKAKHRRHRLGVIGLIIVVAMALFAVAGPWIIGRDPNQINLGARLLPFWTVHDGQLHVFGTDSLGRDVLARLAIGARASMGVVLAALFVGGGIGCVLGILAGFYGGWRDNVIMRLVDAQLSLPGLVFAMIIAAVLGVGFRNTVLALGFATWPIYARLLRAEVMRVRKQEYVEAAQTFGVSTWRLMFVYIIPNVIGVLAVVGTLELGRMILVESSLSFVGLGMQPPDASWGSMIRQGQDYIYNAWWIPTLPGVFIMVTVLGMNLMGDWLRDILDPKTR